jgi:hypothetical protein
MSAAALLLLPRMFEAWGEPIVDADEDEDEDAEPTWPGGTANGESGVRVASSGVWPTTPSDARRASRSFEETEGRGVAAFFADLADELETTHRRRFPR